MNDQKDQLQIITKKINWKYSIIIFSMLLLWASSYVAIRHSLEVFSAENLAFLRYLSASAGFIMVACLTKISIPAIRDIPGLMLLGFFGFSLYNLLLNFGERTVNAGIASFIINTIPFFTMLFVIIQKQETVSKADWSGLLIAFSGVSIIIFSSNSRVSFDYNTLFVLGAALSQALYFALQKKLLKKYSPLDLTSYAVWSGTIILFFFSKKSFQSFAVTDWYHILSVIYLGLFPGMIGYLIMAYALKKYRSTNVTSYLFLIPFITLFLGWILLKEIPSNWAIIGGILIVAGIIVKNKLIPINMITSTTII